MMNRLMRYSCLLLCLSAGLTACDDDGIDVLDIEIPEGYALIHRQTGCRVFTTVALMMVTGFTMMCVRVAMAWEVVLARSMRGILVAVVIVMPAVPNRRCGVKVDRVVTGFPRCWFI